MFSNDIIYKASLLLPETYTIRNDGDLYLFTNVDTQRSCYLVIGGEVSQKRFEELINQIKEKTM